jgi:hypothetical protein
VRQKKPVVALSASKLVHGPASAGADAAGGGRGQAEVFSALIARNPLKRPDSDEENKIKQNKTKEIKARFACFSFVCSLVLLGRSRRESIVYNVMK